MKTKFTKTRGHHCWWLRKDGKEICNFDENHEHVLDDILNMQEVNVAMYKMIERLICNYQIDASVVIQEGCESRYLQDAELVKLLLAKARGEQHE